MTMNSRLVEYIEREIIPLYSSFDRAHQSDHAREVIDRSLALAAEYDVDINMVYTIAAYHDTGLTAGRERHHIVSAEILAADKFIREHFTPEQIVVMQNSRTKSTLINTSFAILSRIVSALVLIVSLRV